MSLIKVIHLLVSLLLSSVTLESAVPGKLRTKLERTLKVP